MTAAPGSAVYAELVGSVGELREQMLSLEAAIPATEFVHPSWRASARNLVHYLAFRRNDLRPLQDQLAAVGLSSLGRAEGGVLASVEAVLAVANAQAGLSPTPSLDPPPTSLADGDRLLAEHTRALLGSPPPERPVRIMVTMPGEAAEQPELIRELLAAGMDCMRVNCAHDTPEAWGKMVAHLRTAVAETGRQCRVLMDLCGPKIRTGPLPPGPKVVKVRPTRDEFGRVVAPARVWLTAEDSPTPAPRPTDAILPLPARFLMRLAAGDDLTFRDARGSRRRLRVVEVCEGGCWAEIDSTAYIVPGTKLKIMGTDSSRKKRKAKIGDLPALESRLSIAIGDTLTVVREPARAACDPPAIGCTLPEVFDDVRTGQSIWFDDGRIGGVVGDITQDGFRVEITRAPPGGTRLGADKGINLPDTSLRLPSLTEKDRADLEFVAAHADMVGYSFVRTPSDVVELQALLAGHGRPDLGIMLKIETQQAFEHLPSLLLQAMHSPAVGVMIARGDLAVECGFERLAEVQEEILWLCEAAHAPVVWATQVLENLAKTGLPSRAEITDAAMGERAECVMLNKGPHVVAAVSLLDDILRRMQAHQDKKRAMLRRLGVATAFRGDSDGARSEPSED